MVVGCIVDIVISLNKAQVQVNQRPPHKTRYAESNKRESRKEPEHIGTGENFLNRTPVAHFLKSTIDKWDVIRLKSFCKARDTGNRIKKQLTDWEKIFTNLTSNKDPITNTYKELMKLDSREPNYPIKNGEHS